MKVLFIVPFLFLSASYFNDSDCQAGYEFVFCCGGQASKCNSSGNMTHCTQQLGKKCSTGSLVYYCPQAHGPSCEEDGLSNDIWWGSGEVEIPGFPDDSCFYITDCDSEETPKE